MTYIRARDIGLQIINVEGHLPISILVSSLGMGMLKRGGLRTMLRKRKKRQEKYKCLVLKAGEESRNQESIKLWETRNEKVNTNAA